MTTNTVDHYDQRALRSSNLRLKVSKVIEISIHECLKGTSLSWALWPSPNVLEHSWLLAAFYNLLEVATRKQMQISKGNKETDECLVMATFLGLVFMPCTWPPPFHILPAPIHSPHRGLSSLWKPWLFFVINLLEAIWWTSILLESKSKSFTLAFKAQLDLSPFTFPDSSPTSLPLSLAPRHRSLFRSLRHNSLFSTVKPSNLCCRCSASLCDGLLLILQIPAEMSSSQWALVHCPPGISSFYFFASQQHLKKTF